MSKVKADIAILGHIAKDIIEIDGKSRSAIGGAVYYGAVAGAHMDLKIAVITRLNKNDFSILNEFTKYGIKTFAYPSRKTSGLRNIYSSKNLEYRKCKPLGFAGLFKKEEIPENLIVKYFVLGLIIAGEIDLPLLNHLYDKYPGKICLDLQGFLREISEINEINYRTLSQSEIEEILSKVNILKLDYAEAQALTNNNEVTIKEAAEFALKFGPKEVLITHAKGISCFTNTSSYYFPWKCKLIKGRTGRGDTSFISYIGSRITKTPEESLKFSAALTSLKLENQGPFTLPLSFVEKLMKEEY